MGRELRSIVLSQPEFEEAVKAHFGQPRSVPVSPNNIATVILSSGPEITAEAVLRHPLLDGRDQVMLDNREIIEVITGYVRKKGHPLPRHGRKSITWLEDDLAMMIELDWF